MAIIGYARVSTNDQTLDLQTDALEKAGCTRIFSDEGVSGSKVSRPELDKCLGRLTKGDTLVIYRLDRLGRSMRHLCELSEGFEAAGISLKSLNDGFDTSTASGRMFFHVLATIAAFERDLIRDRTNAGLQAARARGKVGGRKKTIPDSKIEMAKLLSKDKSLSISEIAAQLGISRASYYRLVKGGAG